MPDAVIDRHDEETLIVRFSPDGTVLAAGRADGVISLWSLDPQPEKRLEIQSGTDFLFDLAFHPEGSGLLASGEQLLKLWRVADGTLVRDFPVQEQEGMHAIAFAPDGARMLVASDFEVGKVIALPSAEVAFEFPVGERTTSFAFHPDGRTVAATCSWQGGSEIRFYRLGDPPEVLDTLSIPRPFDVVAPAAFSPDGHFLAFGDRDLNLFSFPALELARAYAPTGDMIREPQPGFLVTAYWSEARFSVDGAQLICGSPSGEILWFDMQSGRLVRRLSGHEAGVLSIALGADGKRLISSSDDGTVRLWDLQGGGEEEG